MMVGDSYSWELECYRKTIVCCTCTRMRYRVKNSEEVTIPFLPLRHLRELRHRPTEQIKQTLQNRDCNHLQEITTALHVVFIGQSN